MKLKFLSLYLVLSLFSGHLSLAMQNDLLQQGSDRLKNEVYTEEIEEDNLSNHGGLLLYDSFSSLNADTKKKKVDIISSEQALNLRNALVSSNLKRIKNALSHVKSFYQNWNEVKSMIEQGADIDDPTNSGWSPIMIASANGDLDIVEWLINHGADVDYQSNYGWTSTMVGAICGYFDIVKLLVENGTDVNIAAENGLTPLMGAAFSGRFRIVEYLIDNGADQELSAEDGSTAPQLASFGQHWDIVDFLKKRINREPVMISPLGISLPTEDYR